MAAGTWAAGHIASAAGKQEEMYGDAHSLSTFYLFQELHTHKVGGGYQSLILLIGCHVPLASLMRCDSHWACTSSRL